MYYHRTAKLIYLAHPRTASRSTRNALLEQARFTQPTYARSGERHRRLEHHAGLEEAGEYIDLDYSQYTIFTTVRNHFDTLVSWNFSSTPIPAEQFDESWVEAFPGKAERYFPEEDRLWALHGYDSDVLLRYETLQEDLNTLLAQHGLPDITLPRVGISQDREPQRDYRKYFDDDTRRAVESRFGQEMSELGYRF